MIRLRIALIRIRIKWLRFLASTIEMNTQLFMDTFNEINRLEILIDKLKE